ncbi:MAG TPA: proprotein convertase P-domain-containing protein [Thermoanaerobaculia bacterium]
MILLAALLAATLSRESLTGIHQQPVPDVRMAADGAVVEVAGRKAVVVIVDQGTNRTHRTHRTNRTDGTEGMAAVCSPVRPIGPVRPIVSPSLERIACFYDTETSALLTYEPLYWTASPARVFEPNPVVALNDPSLHDRNDAASAVPAQAYSNVTVDATAPLAGPHVVITNLSPPATPIPDASGPLDFDRQDDFFEAVHAYFHIDRNQRYLQSLGYTGSRQLVAYPIPVDPHGANGTDNSFFIPAATLGRGALHFGDGGTDDAEDADLLIHEYGHAILEWISPGTFGGPFSSQARAMSEGFGDYWAFSNHYERRVASGRDPFCLADWDTRCWEDASSENCGYPAGTDCLRRLDSPNTMANYVTTDLPGTEHRNGTIWSSALREIYLSAGKRTTDILVLESLFGTPPNPTFAGVARRMVEVDRLLFAGAHVPTICAAMAARGILSDCGALPRGELTHFQSPQQGIAIPEIDPAGAVASLTIADTRAIERVYVRVDIAHEERGDLRIVLIAPDGTEIVLQGVSGDRGEDVRTTFGLDVEPDESLDVLRGRSAAGVWRLRVTDARLRDTGTLESWALILQLAGDVPLAQRPRGTQFIPVVAHVTSFRSELRLFAPEATTVTLVYTPSGTDGRTSFSAVQVALNAGQVVVFDDVVRTLFGNVGSGSIELAGNVLASSRTYSEGESGEYGQLIPALRGAALPLYLPMLRVDEEFRTNVGFTETSGIGGRIRLRYQRRSVLIDLAPFAHVQIPVEATGVAVVECASEVCPEVIAYSSMIDRVTSDPTFVPAVRLPTGEPLPVIAPVIHARGANRTRWMSDVWFSDLPSRTYEIHFDVAESGLAVYRVRLAGLQWQFVGSRTWTEGSYGQYVPFATPTAATKHLLHIEQSAARRTNLGLLTDEGGTARVLVYDAAGNEIARSEHTLGALQIVQFPLLTPVVNGRVTVEVLSGIVYAYASVVDNLSGDPLFVPGP